MALTKISGSILKDPLNLGEVSIGGTLTYQDVTNVDSVGIITARSTIDAQGDVSIADKIIHTGDTNTAIRFPAADTITAETGGSERFRIASDGKVGIGTDNPASDLHINSAVPTIRFTDSDTSQYSDILQSGHSLYISGDRGSSGSGGIIFRTQGTNERLRISSNGTTTATGTSDGVLQLDTSDSRGAFIRFGQGGSYHSMVGCADGLTNGDKEDLGVRAADNIIFAAGGPSEKLRITSAGAVIIGDTTSTSQNDRLLQIGKTNRSATYLELRTSTSGVGGIVLSDGTGGGDEGYRGTIEYIHSSDYMIFKTAADERLRINSSGSVLFKGGEGGTDAISVQSEAGGMNLQISNFRGVTDTGDGTRLGVGKNNNILIFTNASGSQVDTFAIGNTDAIPLVFSTANTERIRIKGDGKTQFSNATDNIIHTSSNSSRLRLFGGGIESVSYGGTLTLHGVSHSAGNYTDLSAATGGHIQFRVGTSEKMRINSDGIMTRPQQPAFSMQGLSSPVDTSEGYTGILSNYITITECNVGGHYKTSGTDQGKFVAPVNGNYFFSAGCLLRLRSGSAGSGELSFYKNGSNISARSLGYSYLVGSNDHDNVTITAIISLTAGDKVHLGSHACSNNLDWYWGQGLGNFSGYLIG